MKKANKYSTYADYLLNDPYLNAIAKPTKKQIREINRLIEENSWYIDYSKFKIGDFS